MPEPDNFTPQEQLQDTTKRVANRIIREYFKDVISLENDLDLTTPRQALLKACLHREDDSLLLTIARNQLFSQYTTYTRDQFPIVAGSLLDEIDASVTYKPKITLVFREDLDDVEAGYKPVEMETSWRLVNETNQTITKTELTTIANKIKANFGTGGGYIFRKGRKLVYYKKKTQGYQFQLLARDLATGKDLIREILSMNGHSLESKALSVSEVDDELEAFPYNPGTQTILGKRKPKPRRRPMTNVRFRYAYATIAEWGAPVYLYSRSYYTPDSLVN
ncbi:hypothetical protein IQ230_13810 [Gloeocapsopsis crepidinum LEGE 06123]|uniref:Uncharacterized protein n=1 Tax=Gloeocapsopsis crepidinum LEGE 06123 TaxID=588587 RepID=A0ABR9UT05_9CHRO|nr:hypothetical protein [Gloeocapsopsis crepidinum]MBE9191402.1 hypothetical protein [Gloeocapsopsis crepidinum LEGE 06123]